ncbi:MAG: Zn-ribbon domain-containing OB-fold protein [Streptosporangiaceae bacterium]
MMTDSAPARPLPDLLEPDTGPFWAATLRRELLYGWCTHCGKPVFYPRRHCPGCGEGGVEHRVSAGSGTLYTFTVMRRHTDPFFASIAPYAVGYVDLDEGFRMLAGLSASDPGQLSCGQRVRLIWEEGSGCNFPLFTPVQP